jgi:hypothetical protein
LSTWTEIEDAVRTWAVEATGLPGTRIIFGEQDGESPADHGPAIEVTVGDMQMYGDEPGVDTVNETNKTVSFRNIGTYRLTVTFKAQSPYAFGDQSARALLTKMQTYIGLDGPRFELNQAGLGLLTFTAVQNLPKVVNAHWESQALFEAWFCVMVTASETIPYIAHVNGQGEVAVPGGSDVDVPIDVDLP